MFQSRSTFHEAKSVCKAEGKVLLELTSQQENDLLSELLLHTSYSTGLLSQVWTGGVGANRGRRSSLFYWDGTTTRIGRTCNCIPYYEMLDSDKTL